jgi:TRAP-type C4-dicarboxylate transport system permease small subunit
LKIGAFFDRIIDLLAFLAGVLVILAMVAVCAEVVMRYFLNSPLIWVSETTEIALLFIAFLGTAWLLKKEGHVKVDIVLARVNPRAQALLGIISSIVGVFICVLLVWYGALVSFQFIQKDLYEPTILELPKGPLLTIIPVGSFFLLIQFLRRMYDHWRRWRVIVDGEQL